ncbi:MAG: leucyl/phenylalanyl-tRNA--protein transferase [Devosiaceae bacterium]|nr:leucyl/phenylalanyl-tRNA--protein transferase [Devosiaceae bacterium MH13]
MTTPITPELLLEAYEVGFFPMSEDADDPGVFWVNPPMRGIIPLDQFHVPRRLARTVRQDVFEVRIDHDFDAVIDGCSASAPGRLSTWINADIRRLYGTLFARGACHTVECWRDGALVGGLYGVALGGAFFGESMFSRERDASKVALVHLVGRLIAGGFTLLDTQFITEHLRQFGATEIPAADYRDQLSKAVGEKADFYCWPAAGVAGALSLQPVSHTS